MTAAGAQDCVAGIAFVVAGSLLLFIWIFARLLSRHGRQQREFLAGAPATCPAHVSRV